VALPPTLAKKFFLSHCNSYEGLAVFKELWNKDKVDELFKTNEESYTEQEFVNTDYINTFVGTIKKNEPTTKLNVEALSVGKVQGAFQEAPEGFEKFVEFDRTKEFRDNLLACDTIVYDLMSNSFEEVDYVIKTLKTSPLTNEKTLVLLSSVMTWVNTPPKFQEDPDEKVDEDAEGEEEEESEPDSDDGDKEDEEPEEVPED